MPRRCYAYDAPTRQTLLDGFTGRRLWNISRSPNERRSDVDPPHPTAVASPSTTRDTRGTLAFIIAPIAFTTVWIVLGFVSDGYDVSDMHIAPYSPVAQPISGLGMGSTAPVTNTSFVAYGLAMA